MAAVPRHLLILLVSVVFQLFCFNYLYLSHYFDICIYLLFILTLPVKIKKLLLLIVCALYGVMLDLMLAGGGLFTMTTTFIGYVRPAIVRLFFEKDEHYSNSLPTSNDMGVGRFIIYAFIVGFLASLFFYVMERLSFANFEKAFLKALFSALFTVPILFFTQLLLMGTRRRR